MTVADLLGIGFFNRTDSGRMDTGVWMIGWFSLLACLLADSRMVHTDGVEGQ